MQLQRVGLRYERLAKKRQRFVHFRMQHLANVFAARLRPGFRVEAVRRGTPRTAPHVGQKLMAMVQAALAFAGGAQRPAPVLKEKRAAPCPRFTASRVSTKSLRILSQSRCRWRGTSAAFCQWAF